MKTWWIKLVCGLGAALSATLALAVPFVPLSTAYDLNGSRIEKLVGTTGSVVRTVYQYDTQNRLVGATQDGAPVFAATYDYRTRRVAVTEGLAPSSPKLFRYDGGDSFQELDGGSLSVEFVRGSGMGGGIGSILYSDRSNAAGPVEYFAYNAVGHTVALTLPSGVVGKTDYYEAFGGTVSSTGSSANNRLANTKERSFTLGLDNHGMRYFDPEVGRYLTRDPIGYGDGLNVYIYVHNNPINHVDPLGLATAITSSAGDPANQTYWDAVKAGKLNSFRIVTDRKQFEEAIEGKRAYVWYEPVYEDQQTYDPHTGAPVTVRVQVGQRPVRAILFDSEEEQQAHAKMMEGYRAEAKVYEGFGRIASMMMFLGGSAGGSGPQMSGRYQLPKALGLSSADARRWYNAQLQALDTSGPLTRETAMRIHGARNALKEKARAMMGDRAAATQLAKEKPLQPFEYYVQKYSEQGYKGEALWKKIIESGSTPNRVVNEQFGIK